MSDVQYMLEVVWELREMAGYALKREVYFGAHKCLREMTLVSPLFVGFGLIPNLLADATACT
jgi:hypothetical protein